MVGIYWKIIHCNKIHTNRAQTRHRAGTEQAQNRLIIRLPYAVFQGRHLVSDIVRARTVS